MLFCRIFFFFIGYKCLLLNRFHFPFSPGVRPGGRGAGGQGAGRRLRRGPGTQRPSDSPGAGARAGGPGEEEMRAVARSPLSLRPGHGQSAFVPPTCLDLAQPVTQRGRPHCGGRETRPRGRRLPAEPRLAAERRPAPRLRRLTLRASWLWGPSRDVPRRCHQAGDVSSADVFTALSAAQAPSGGSPPASARSPVPSVCPPSSSWLPELQSGLCGSPAPVAWQDSQSPSRRGLSRLSARSPRSWLVADLSPRLCLGPQTGHRSS